MPGENIQHFNAVRFRVNGTGILRSTFYSLDDSVTQTLPNLTMATSPGLQPTILSNFIQQRARLECKTTAINEYVKINRIIIFSREIFSSYPG
jgi:hypothetical protein